MSFNHEPSPFSLPNKSLDRFKIDKVASVIAKPSEPTSSSLIRRISEDNPILAQHAFLPILESYVALVEFEAAEQYRGLYTFNNPENQTVLVNGLIKRVNQIKTQNYPAKQMHLLDSLLQLLHKRGQGIEAKSISSSKPMVGFMDGIIDDFGQVYDGVFSSEVSGPTVSGPGFKKLIQHCRDMYKEVFNFPGFKYDFGQIDNKWNTCLVSNNN